MITISEKALSTINEGGWIVRGGRLAKAQGIPPGMPITQAFVPGRPVKNVVDNHGPLEIHGDDGRVLRVPAPTPRSSNPKEGEVYTISELTDTREVYDDDSDADWPSVTKHTTLCRVVFSGTYLDRQQTREGSEELYREVLRQGVQVVLENPEALAALQAQKAEERARAKTATRRAKRQRQQHRRRLDWLFQEQVRLTDGAPVEKIERKGAGVVIRFANGHALEFSLLEPDPRTFLIRGTDMRTRMAFVLGDEPLQL